MDKCDTDAVLAGSGENCVEESKTNRMRRNVLAYCRNIRFQGGKPSDALAKIEARYIAILRSVK